MKRFLLLFAAGFVAVLIQVTLLDYLPLGGLKPDLLLIVVLYIGFFLPSNEGGVLCFALGYVEDLFSGHLMGLFTLMRVVAWLAARLMSGMLNLKSVLAQTIFVAIYSIADYFIMVGALRLFGGAEFPVPSAGADLWRLALLNAAAAPLVITLLLRADRRLSRDQDRRSLELLR